MRRPLTIGSALLVSLSVATAFADETTASLSWVRLPGAESCIPAQALARAVEQHLGKSVFVSPSVAGLNVEGRVERDGAGAFVATVHATRADGTDLGVRTLTSEASAGCRGLDDNLALVLALMIDPDAVARVQEAKDKPVPPPAAVPPPPPPQVIVRTERVEVPVDRTPSEPEEPWRGEARVGATLGWGILPGSALGFFASGQLEPPDFWPLSLTGHAFTERRAETDDGGANFSFFAASLTTCPSSALAQNIRASACAGLSAGALRARGFGYDHVDEGTKPVIAIVSSLRLSFDLVGPLIATTGLGLNAAVVRPRYVVTEPGGGERDVFQMNAVGGMAEIGVGLRFHP